MLKCVDLATLFAIDVRALAALRMALAALLLFDLGKRSVDLAAFGTDEGVMSVAAARDWAGTPWRWSLHTLSGGPAWQATLFAIAGLFAVMLAIGYRTRLATVVSWALLISLHARTPLVTTGGDLMLRMLLFWGMFLPLGARGSVDASLRARRGKDSSLTLRVGGVASAAILLQVAIVYFFSGLHKWNEIWLGGEAMQRIFNNDLWSRPLGRALAEFPTLLHGLTLATLGFEIIAPVLLFSPWRTEKVRMIVVVVLALMHLFIELTMSVGLFSWVALAGLLLFLPPRVWDALEQRLVGGESFRRPAEIAADRRRDSPPTIVNVICAFFLVYIVLWNVSDARLFGGRLTFLRPRPLWPVAYASSIDQRWTMFAEPPATNGWFVAEARLRDGQVVDLLRGGEAASEERPATPIGVYRNQRWQKLFANLLEPHLVRYRDGVAEYFAREWNRAHDKKEQVVVLDLYFFEHRRLDSDHGSEVRRHGLARVELGGPEETDAFSELLERIR